MDERELRMRADELRQWLLVGQSERDEAADGRCDAIVEAIREQTVAVLRAVEELTRAVTALTAETRARR